MPDITSFTAAASALTQAYNTVQSVKEIAKRMENAELRLAIADLTGNLADAKIELAQALEENLQIRRELDERDRIADIRSKLFKEDNVYKTVEPIDGYGNGPFCMRCLDVDGVLVNVQITHHKASSNRHGDYPAYDSYRCFNCIIRKQGKS